MDSGEFQTLMTKIQGFYGDKFPGLPPGMAKFWFESLRYLDADIVDLALHRWARQHTLKSPSLDELQEQVEYVQDEERLSRRSGSSTKHWLDVLKDAAETQAKNPERSDDDATYGRLMTILAERSISPWFDRKGQQHPKLTMEQRGQQCCLWARKYEETHPQLAADLKAAARQFGVPMYMGTAAYANDHDRHREQDTERKD